MTLRITTGFLTGNIFEGQDFDTPVDERASADRYADLSHDAIKRAYPEASVEVNYQWAIGSIPHNLQTRVSEEDVDNLTDTTLGDIAENVDRITAEVWEEFNWIVELGGE